LTGTQRYVRDALLEKQDFQMFPSQDEATFLQHNV
jgi:hypothetical protein